MRREWTSAEETYMNRRYLSQPVEVTAEKLGRTKMSVIRKASKMKLNHYSTELNAKSLARSFCCDCSVTIRWIKKYGLKSKEIKCSNQTRHLIMVEDFWAWAEENKEKINWSKYQRYSLVPEPEWVKDAIREYKTPKAGKKFTQQEIVLVKNLLKRDLTYRQIAEQMGRSYYSISRLCRKIYRI